MRENIGLYRGKRIDNGEWVYGYYEPPVEFDGHKFGMTISYIGNCGWLDDAEIDPETVGECSGVPDKNGILMYEGDVVKGRFLFRREVLSVVKFKNGSFGLAWKRGDAEEFTAFTSMCNIEYEIIGNIHDNPELLTQKNI